MDNNDVDVSASFAAVLHLQVFTAAITYQQFAVAQGFERSWAAERLEELAATLERENAELANPNLGEYFVHRLRKYAEQIKEDPEPYAGAPPSLSVIDGGKAQEGGSAPLGPSEDDDA